MSRWSVHRKDENHDQIAQAFRDLGAEVFEIHLLGGGAPDLIVVPNANAIRVDVKNPGNNKGKSRTRLQKDKWKGGKVYYVQHPFEAIALMQEAKCEKTK